MNLKPSKSDRRHPRIPTPQGVWVAWQDVDSPNAKQTVSRVSDLNVGGLFVTTTEVRPHGAIVSVLLSVPEGEIRATAVVRNSIPGQGMGVEFTEMSQQDSARIHLLVTRLLRTQAADASRMNSPT
ncbi:MAG: PilZ domain-containing protein [Candidatus Acidiferrales bacterium]